MTEPDESTAFLAVAHVLKEHSFAKNNRRTYKIKLLNPNSSSLKKISCLYLAPDIKSPIPLLAPSRPLKGEWGKTDSALITVAEKYELRNRQMLWLCKKDLEKLKENEFYLSEILDFAVIDEQGDPHGRVRGFFFGPHENITLSIQDKNTEFECPQEWISKVDIANKTVVIDSVYQWKF